MTILIQNTIINCDLVESIHFDDYNARISVIFNSTNTRRFDFFDPNDATEEDWLKYDAVVNDIASKYNKFYTLTPRKNPFSEADWKEIIKEATNSHAKENNI
tara:strand:+ start:255 stop:560 length:306 start_codon:yes stop_codon:yes gene_type:complete